MHQEHSAILRSISFVQGVPRVAAMFFVARSDGERWIGCRCGRKNTGTDDMSGAVEIVRMLCVAGIQAREYSPTRECIQQLHQPLCHTQSDRDLIN